MPASRRRGRSNSLYPREFHTLGIRCIDVNNYPILGELEAETGWEGKRREVCYVGGINAIRGAVEVISALELLRTDSRLNLAGIFQEKAVEDTIRHAKGWSRVNELGFLDRHGVRDVLSRSVAGLVTLHPTTAYLDSLPVKMFEYMSAGIPVIASNFPLWRQIVEENECGLCVDPLDPKAIAAAIDHLVENPQLARRMGETAVAPSSNASIGQASNASSCNSMKKSHSRQIPRYAVLRLVQTT